MASILAPFGLLFSSFSVPFSYLKIDQIFVVFSCVFGSSILSFWLHFGVILEAKIYQKSHRSSKAVLGSILAAPGHAPRSKTWIFIGGLFKIEGRPFRARGPPRSILEAKMEPKRRPKPTRKAQKMHLESLSEKVWIWELNLEPFGVILGSVWAAFEVIFVMFFSLFFYRFLA